MTYTPGAKQRLTVTIADPDLARWAFQLTARLASNLSSGQGGAFTSPSSLTQVVSDGTVQFIQTTSGGTQQGVRGSATYQVDWTAPAANVGNIAFYIAGMAANGSGAGGDHVYTANYTMSPATGPAPSPTLLLGPSSLTFNYPIGGALPLAQNVTVTSSGASLNYTVAASGGSWLSAAPVGAATTPGGITVSVNPVGMSAGSYNGTVTIAAVGSNSPQTVPVALAVTAAPTPAADSSQFKYNIVRIANTKPGQYPEITFSVTDPTDDNKPYDIKAHPSFTQTANGASRLFVQVGWDTRDYTNTGSGSELAQTGAAAAQPIAIDALANSVPGENGKYTVTSRRPIPTSAQGTGVAAIEGHPAGQDATGAWTQRIPVKSVYKYFLVGGATLAPRRQIVDTKKCKSCHGVLSLHGNNRTDEVQVCVICHNPNATDIPYRVETDGPETPIDFKVMVHSIHAAKMRSSKYVVIGRNHSVNDFSTVQFPANLNDCRTCHREDTYLLPMKSPLGTTVNTQSVTTATKPIVNNEPADDLKITPTAATCSACHDNREAHDHMIRKGASFATLQQSITSGAVKEKCNGCHGAGKDKDVAKVHSKD